MSRTDGGSPPLGPDASSAAMRWAPPPSDAAAAAAAAAAKPKGGARVLSLLLQAVVMAAALAVFFLFAGVAAFVLLHLCVAGRTIRRRRQRPAGRAPDDAPAGLPPDQLRGLPWFEYSGPSASRPCPQPDCAVCLEGFVEGEKCRALPPCMHVFHVACVDRWLVRSPGCPICRAHVGTAAPEPAVGRPVGWI